MNVKVTGAMLATLMACTLIQPSQAVQPRVAEPVQQVGGVEELLQVISAEASAARQAAEDIQHPEGIGLYLDSTPLLDVEREMYQGECYVTVESFLSVAQPQAVVEEVDGGLSVTAATTTQLEDGQVKEETLQMTVYDGASYLVANDRYLYLNHGVANLNGDLAIPVDTMAKILNLEMVEDGETGYIRLYTQEGQAYLTPGSVYYNSDDYYWLSRIINAESGNQPLAGKIAVGNVVLNRVASYKFPNSVYGVIFQANQFTPASSGSIYNNPNWDSQVAAKLVLDGAVVLDNALFFNVAGLNSYASRNRAYVATIGAHAFYA